MVDITKSSHQISSHTRTDRKITTITTIILTITSILDRVITIRTENLTMEGDRDKVVILIKWKKDRTNSQYCLLINRNTEEAVKENRSKNEVELLLKSWEHKFKQVAFKIITMMKQITKMKLEIIRAKMTQWRWSTMMTTKIKMSISLRREVLTTIRRKTRDMQAATLHKMTILTLCCHKHR